MDATALSGTIKGSNLILMGVESIPLVLKRDELSDYQAQLAELEQRSRAAISQKAALAEQKKTLQAQPDFKTEINQLVERMQKFDSEADFHLGRLPAAEKNYVTITAKVTLYVTEEHQLAGNPHTSNPHGQLMNAATLTSNATDRVHDKVESLRSSLESNIDPITAREKQLEAICKTLESRRNELSTADVASRLPVCGRLLGAAHAFHQK
jgi:uncharacterized phage infection (PIP) family protein YhgE